MAKPKMSIGITDVIENARAIYADVSPAGLQDLKMIEGIAVYEFGNGFTVRIAVSSIYDFNEVLAEIRAINEGIPQVFMEAE